MTSDRVSASLIARLDAVDAMPDAVRLRLRTYDLLSSGAPGPILDVGCGAGRAVAELTARGRRAVGVDPDENALALARHRHPGAAFRRGDAFALPFADGSCAGYRADKVFHELAHPEAALVEARRILAPGGRIVLAGQDWDTLVIDADDPALTRRMVHARADLVTSPHAARRYHALLRSTGFDDVRVEVHTWVLVDGSPLPMLLDLAEAARSTGAVTAAEAHRWTTDQRERAAEDRSFVAIPMFVAAAGRAA